MLRKVTYLVIHTPVAYYCQAVTIYIVTQYNCIEICCICIVPQNTADWKFFGIKKSSTKIEIKTK